MKRKVCSICLAVSLIVGMTGCGSQIPEMTEEERAAISEYAVELLLKYDSNQNSRLVDLELLEEEPEPTSKPVITPPPVQEPNGMDEIVDTPLIEPGEMISGEKGDIRTALGLADSLSIVYEEYQVVSECADTVNKDLVLEAENGKKLLVCNFALVNDGADKQSVDMLLEKIKYTFVIDDKVVNAQVTMLSNDLATYMGILDADEARKVVLLMEAEEEKLNNAEHIYLQIERGDEKATIQIK